MMEWMVMKPWWDPWWWPWSVVTMGHPVASQPDHKNCVNFAHFWNFWPIFDPFDHWGVVGVNPYKDQPGHKISFWLFPQPWYDKHDDTCQRDWVLDQHEEQLSLWLQVVSAGKVFWSLSGQAVCYLQGATPLQVAYNVISLIPCHIVSFSVCTWMWRQLASSWQEQVGTCANCCQLRLLLVSQFPSWLVSQLEHHLAFASL